jgi:uncharacterized SAM-binding protein YcdF (DUF218 family)
MTAQRAFGTDCCGTSHAGVRRRALVIGSVLVAALIVLVLAAFINLGRWVAAGAAVPEPGDVIVALGGDDGHRIKRAAELFAAGFAPTVLITGLEGAPNAERQVYLDWRAKVLAGKGVPPDRVVFELTAKNSFEEAVASLELMRARGWQKALVISDAPHMRRLDWVWDRVFSGSGKTYRLVSSEAVWWDADRWWRSERSGQFVLSEVIKLGYYLVKY